MVEYLGLYQLLLGEEGVFDHFNDFAQCSCLLGLRRSYRVVYFYFHVLE